MQHMYSILMFKRYPTVIFYFPLFYYHQLKRKVLQILQIQSLDVGAWEPSHFSTLDTLPTTLQSTHILTIPYNVGTPVATVTCSLNNHCVICAGLRSFPKNIIFVPFITDTKGKLHAFT